MWETLEMWLEKEEEEKESGENLWASLTRRLAS